MRIRISAFILLMCLLVQMSCFAYTDGIERFAVPLGDGVITGAVAVSDGKLRFTGKGSAEYDMLMPFNAIGVDIAFEGSVPQNAYLEIDGQQFKIEGTGNHARIDFSDRIEVGDIKLKISLETAAQIVSVVFEKENDFIYWDGHPQYDGWVSAKLTEFEAATRYATAVKPGASAMIVRGAKRYIDNSDPTECPFVYEGSIYLPIHTFARAFGFYYEDMGDKAYALLRYENTDWRLQNGVVTKQVDCLKPVAAAVDSFIYQNGETFVKLRYFIEEIGRKVGYKDGIAIVDYANNINRIFASASYMNEYKKIFSEFEGAAKQGETYYVAQSTNASDDNDGSFERPWRTLKKAGEMAKAGDVVNIRSGVYNECLSPKNNGEAANPIVFKSYENEDVTLSAVQRLAGWTDYKDNIIIMPMNWDLGDGRNQVFINGEPITEARHPNTDTKEGKSTIPHSLNLSPLWPTYGNIMHTPEDAMVLVSDTDLEQEPGFWKGATVYTFNGKGFGAGYAKVDQSEPGKLYVSGTSEAWWFDGVNQNDYGFLSGVMSALDCPGEWILENGNLYIIPPENVDMNTAVIEAKREQVVIDLSKREYVRVQGLKTFGGGVKMNETEMCMLEGLDMKYIGHYVYSRDQKDGYIEDGQDYHTDENGNRIDPNAPPQRGELGIYMSGENDIILNTRIDHSAGAGLFVTGSYSYIENNVIANCGYAGSYVGGVFITSEHWKDELIKHGGHSIFQNSIYNSGRMVLGINDFGSQNGSRHGTKTSLPYMQFDIAYNKMHDANMAGRDTGVVYNYRTNCGTDILKSKIHHNVIYNSWATERPANTQPVLSAGIYHDNLCTAWETFDNIVFATEVYAMPNRAIFSQPDSWNMTWGNYNLGIRKNGVASLAVEDYPHQKPFFAGSTLDTEQMLLNYNNVQPQNVFYVENCIRNGAKLENGIAYFENSGQKMTFGNIDMGDGKNALIIDYAGRYYKHGNKCEITVTQADGTSAMRVVEMDGNGIRRGQTDKKFVLFGKTLSGLCEVTIKPLTLKELGIRSFTTEMEQTDNGEYLVKINAGNYDYNEQVRLPGDNAYTKAYVGVGDIDSAYFGILRDTWPGTNLGYYNIEFAAEATEFAIAAGTTEKYSGAAVKIKIDDINSEPIGTAYYEAKKSFNDYSPVVYKLDRPIPVGTHNVYICVEKGNSGENSSSANIEWFAFK